HSTSLVRNSLGCRRSRIASIDRTQWLASLYRAFGLRPVGGPARPFQCWNRSDVVFSIGDRRGFGARRIEWSRSQIAGAGCHVQSKERPLRRLEYVERRARSGIDIQQPEPLAVDVEIHAVEADQ